MVPGPGPASLPAMSGRSLLVVAADKLRNARAILGDHQLLGEALYDRFRGGKDGTLWHYRAIADRQIESGPPALAVELNRIVAALEAAGTGRGQDR